MCRGEVAGARSGVQLLPLPRGGAEGGAGGGMAGTEAAGVPVALSPEGVTANLYLLRKPGGMVSEELTPECCAGASDVRTSPQPRSESLLSFIVIFIYL